MLCLSTFDKDDEYAQQPYDPGHALFDWRACALPTDRPQLDIWLDQTLHGETPLYNIGGYARINGVVDAARLQQAIDQVVRDHDALRIQLEPGSPDHPLPRQRFLVSVSVPLALLDVSGQDDPEAAALALMQENLQTPFSFDGGLLLRMVLLKVGEGLYYLFVNCHHLIVDGWAFAMLGRAVSQAYTVLQNQGESAACTPTYRAYIERQKTDRTRRPFSANASTGWINTAACPSRCSRPAMKADSDSA
ncbi:condensation domain-containing protein [Pseudomonas sp. PCH446]